MTDQDARRVLSLRLLIARAAIKDSLAWWDDDSLTQPARFVLERIFPGNPPAAGRRLALRAAFARHAAVCPTEQYTLHLFRLDPDNQDRLALRYHSLRGVDAPDKPVASLDELRVQLLKLTGGPMPYRIERKAPMNTLQVAIPDAPPGEDPIVHRAKTLAWVYLESQPGQVQIPFCVATPKPRLRMGQSMEQSRGRSRG